MPGAPNRPPEKSPEEPPAPPPAESPAERVIRRLAPSRVALLLDVWKGAPSPELLVPLEKADTAYASGDFENASSALDLLSVRFTEPRWPTLPDPFRRLRVSIPAPTPPHWDPEHGLAPTERESRRLRRTADDQIALVEASVAWASAHGVDTADLIGPATEAKTLLSTEGVSAAFYERTDRIWKALRERTPFPGSGAPRPAAPTAAASPAEEA